MNGTIKDYIKISYRDGGNLYVLATGLDADSEICRLPMRKRRSLISWEPRNGAETKYKGARAPVEVAKDLVELYAARQQKEGFPYGKDTVWQREFEEMFPFEETEDQLAAIEATKEDMESHEDHGPADLRRCGLRKDGDCHPGGV